MLQSPIVGPRPSVTAACPQISQGGGGGGGLGFQGSRVSEFQGFRFSAFQGFTVSGFIRVQGLGFRFQG